MTHSTQEILGLTRDSGKLPVIMQFKARREARQYRDYLYSQWRGGPKGVGLRPMIRIKGKSLILYSTAAQLITPKEVHGNER